MKDIKLGLALSGGGFRAALFHIGVLARLAELDLLRQVAVLSTVSGGSIIGASYYLKLKQLLEGQRADHPAPTPEAYLTIIRELEQEFLAAVQQNIRMRAFLDPIKNAKMVREDYSRSDRMGELYTEYFFGPILGTRDVHLTHVHITPKGQLPGFDVDQYNIESDYKIPILTVNATCLNTGHPWHFTGSWIGEPLASQSPTRSLGKNPPLKQLRFDGVYRDDPLKPLSEKQKNKLREITLGDAVAASACVPGIFDPLAIHDLYENSQGEEIVVELVDGGVFDNQGLDALFAAGCTHIICSDASGQLEDERVLSTRFYNVIERSTDTMMDRIRQQGFYVLDDKTTESGYAFFHLRETFPASPDYPAIPGDPGKPDSHVYRLANLRTDLDAFSDLEAYTLMYDGYCLSSAAIEAKKGLGIPAKPLPRLQDWRFLSIREVLKDPAKSETLLKNLKVGRQQFFKPYYLTPWASLAAAPFAVILTWLAWAFKDTQIVGAMSLGEVTLAGVLAGLAASPKFGRWLRGFDQLRKLWRAVIYQYGYLWLVAPLLVGGIGALGAWIHLKIFNRLFLWVGRI